MARRPPIERIVFSVAPYQGGWAVESEGAYFDPSDSKEEAEASAHRRARACLDAGRPSSVQVRGSRSFASL